MTGRARANDIYTTPSRTRMRTLLDEFCKNFQIFNVINHLNNNIMKKVIITIMALCAIAFATSCNNHHHTTAEEAVENSIYASSDDVMECYAVEKTKYRVNGTTIVSKCAVAVSCDGVEFADTYRFVWWNGRDPFWKVAKDLKEVAEWQQEEAARKTALREWADTL